MKILIWSLRIVVFLLLLAFAAKNSGVVTVRFFFDASWSMPLNLIILISFAAGAGVGVAVALVTLLRQRRELRRSRQEREEAPAAGQPRGSGADVA